MSKIKRPGPIGHLISIDLDSLLVWRKTISDEQISTMLSNWTPETETEFRRHIKNKYVLLSRPNSFSKTTEECMQEHLEKYRIKLEKRIDYGNEFNNPIHVYLTGKPFSVIGWSDFIDLLPTEFLEISLFKNYDDIPVKDLPRIMGLETEVSEQSLISINGQVLGNQSKKDLKEELEETKLQIQEEEEKVKQAVEKIRQEARLKEIELRNQMEEAMKALELKKKEFETIIFKLDHQLYTLRCLLGDTVSISHLRKGKTAPKEQPVVLYQKLRFLDEDLVKINKLYGYSFDEEEYVEKILAKDDFVLNQFCPNEKCIVLLKITKDNTGYSRLQDNTLERWRYDNGNRIAILVRNGENLYLAWTEDERIFIKENLVITKKETELENLEAKQAYEQDDDTITNNDFMSGNTAWVQFFSRQFLFAIFQGFVQYQKILEFPEKVNVYGESKYVIFSTADNQLIDDTFGTLSDYIRSRNKLTKEGDFVLPTQSISGSFSEKSWSGSGYFENFERGRGDRNRVRGLVIPDTVQTINLVEAVYRESYVQKIKPERIQQAVDRGDTEELERLKAEVAVFNNYYPLLVSESKEVGIPEAKIVKGNVEYSLSYRDAKKGYVWKENNSRYKINENHICMRTYKTGEEAKKYYISVDKPEEYGSNRSGKVAVRSNIQIHSSEFLNLTWLSSSMLTYFIETKQVGKYFGTNYAYIVNYLHKALEFIKARENEEYIQVSRFASRDISKIPYIDYLLNDFKYTKGYRRLTDNRARIFARYIVSISDYEQAYKEAKARIDWKPEPILQD